MTATQMQGERGGEPRRGFGETWAKAILMGEHSVVYGYPAVAVPIQTLKMRAWATPVRGGFSELSDEIAGDISGESVGADGFTRNSNSVSKGNGKAGRSGQDNLDGRGNHGQGTLRALGYYGPLSQAPAQFDGLVRAAQVASEFAGYADRSFDIVTRSDFPAGRGLGSSAAASGAVIRAVLDACGVTASAEQLAALTNEAEIVTHGNPSGLDTVTTSGSHPVLFTRGDMRRVDVHLPAYLVIADSGIAGSTKQAVEGVHGRYENDHRRVRTILESLGDLARQSANDLEQGGLDSLGRCMDEAHGLLDTLRVSHPVVNALVRTARASGALGAKMTGGGLGGCIIALAPDDRSAEHVRRALLAAGAPAARVHPLNQLDVEVAQHASREFDTSISG
ncbi:MAG: mevalonate kinase [Bifidobacterium tibiigranuli]|nr:mevalonate kinase [Bifidobacterium tibiigranuli]